MPSLNWKGKPKLEDPPGGYLTAAAREASSPIIEAFIHPLGGKPAAMASDRLILGDNLEIMRALLPDYEARVALIYADPPFFTNRRFHARIGRGEDSRRPDSWSSRCAGASSVCSCGNRS